MRSASTVILHLPRGAAKVAAAVDPAAAQAVPRENRRMATGAQRRSLGEDVIDLAQLLQGQTRLGACPSCATTRSTWLRGLPVVELEQSTEPLTTLHRTG